MARDSRWLQVARPCRWAAQVMIVPCVALPLLAQSSRDSAGVRIVESPRPTWTAQERLRLAASPRLIIGASTAGPYEFRRVRGVMRLSDGRLAVADGGSTQLRFFSPDGQFLTASAGVGNAPGQLASIEFVYRLRGDTIALRSGLESAYLYTSTGDFVREMSLPGPPVGRRAPRRYVHGMFTNGRRIASPIPNPAPRAAGTRWVDSLEVHILAESGEVDVSLGLFPFLEFEQGADYPSPPWLSAIGVFAGGEDRLYAGFGDRYEIRVFSGTGALHSIFRRAWTPAPITPEDWEEWVVEWSKLWVKEQGAARDSAVNRVRRAPYATKLPAFSAFLVDRTGRLWVRGAHWEDAVGAGSYTDMPAVPSQWSVFDIVAGWARSRCRATSCPSRLARITSRVRRG